MKRICNNKKCPRSEIIVETSFDETVCKNCGGQLSETDKEYKDKFFSGDQGKKNAKLAWENISSWDKGNYKSFDDFYKKGDWQSETLGENVSKSIAGGVGAIIFYICIIVGVIYLFSLPSKVSKHFDEKSDNKSYCQTSYKVQNAKTEFAAKKAYEKCMSNK
jgi:hypothetical protein